MSTYQDVINVNKHHGVPMATKPTFPNVEDFSFRHDFLLEELDELEEAFSERSLVGIVDAIADILIVAYGFAATMGLPMDEILEIVNAANTHGKRLVTSAEESKRSYRFDLKKTKDFVSPEAAIFELLKGAL